MNIPEEFLHYLWKYKLFDYENVTDEESNEISVLHTGTHNYDAGPDFLNAKIKIGSQIWAGNIEIHKKASDWKKHGHHKDKGYDSVILHITAEKDTDKTIQNKRQIPTISPKFNINLLKNYQQFMQSATVPMCADDLPAIDNFTRSSWMQTLMIERFERKTTDLKRLLNYTNNNWEEAFYIFLASAFGSKVNSVAFELTAKSLASIILAKHKSQLFQIEALLFGQAGLLTDNENPDDYTIRLQKEYNFLKKKFKLKPIQTHLWKYLRIRPANFPDIRIAQFATLIYNSVHLFSKILKAETLNDIEKMFEPELDEYWDTHYSLGKKSKKRKKNFGKTARNLVIINTIIPTLFLYGKEKNLPQFMEKAGLFLEKIKPENNKIIRRWTEVGIIAKNAADSQALIQLYKEYCKKKRCLNCRFGNRIIR